MNICLLSTIGLLPIPLVMSLMGAKHYPHISGGEKTYLAQDVSAKNHATSSVHYCRHWYDSCEQNNLKVKKSSKRFKYSPSKKVQCINRSEG